MSLYLANATSRRIRHRHIEESRDRELSRRRKPRETDKPGAQPAAG